MKFFSRCGLFVAAMLAVLLLGSVKSRVWAQCEAVVSVGGTNFQDTTACGPLLLKFSDTLSSGAVNRTWRMGDGTQLTTNNPSHVYQATTTETNYQGSLTIECANGETDVDSFEVTLLASPVADFQLSGTNLCGGVDTLFIQNQSQRGPEVYYRWNFDDFSTPTFTASPSDTQRFYNFPGVYRLELFVVDSANQCDTRVTETITVNPAPNPQFELNSATGCAPFALEVRNTTPVDTNLPVESWEWEWGDGDSSSGQDPGPHVYDSVGVYTVRLTANTQSTGCSNFSTQRVEVRITPDAQMATSSSPQNPVCPGDTVRLYYTGSDSGIIERYRWELGPFIDSVHYRPDSIGVVFGGGNTERRVALQVFTAACDSTAEDSVFLLPEPPVAFLDEGDTSVLCGGERVSYAVSPPGRQNYRFFLDGALVQVSNTNRITLDTVSRSADLVVAARSGPNNCVGFDTLGLIVKPFPELSMERLTPGDTACENATLEFRVQPPNLEFYTFFDRFAPFSEGIPNQATFTTGDEDAVIYAEALVEGCTGLSDSIRVPVSPELNEPQVNCGITDSTSIEFIWDPVQGAEGYELRIDGGAFQTPSSGASGLSHTIDGLTVGDVRTIEVRALGSRICGAGPLSFTQSCEATPVRCEPIFFDTSPDTTLCAGDSVTFAISNLSTDTFGVLWGNAVSPVTDTSIRTAFRADTNFFVSVKDSTQNELCPAATRYTRVEVPLASLDTLFSTNTINDTVCGSIPIEVVSEPRNLDRYRYLVDGLQVRNSRNPVLRVDTLSRSSVIRVEALEDGCPLRPDSLSITVVDTPTLSLTSTIGGRPACFGDSVSVSGVPGDLAFYRFFVNGFPEQSGSQSVLSLGSLTQGLTVQATAESRYRCPVRNFSELDIEVQERPEVNLTTNLMADSLCEGDSALLIASSGFPTYRFLSGDSVLSVQSSNRFAVDSALPRGSAAVTVRDTLGCAGDTSEAVSYRYVAIPQISATASADSICIGEEVELRIEASPSFTDLEYAWSNGRQEASFRLTPGRSISLSAAIRRDGCPAGRDSVGLFVDTTGTPELSLSAPDTVCVEEAYLLQAGGAETYRWREAGGGDAAALLSATDVAQPTLTVGLPDTPSLSLVLEGRNRICRSESPLTLPVSRCLTSLPAGAIPQIITPNGDGINDVWRIEGIDFEDFRNNRVRILNRWGQEVFTASPYRNNWSGENKEGEELPAGTYYYVVDLGTGAEKRTGFVIIQR